MNLIILAAGRGSRLGEITDNLPKALLPIGNGLTLIENQIIGAIESNLFNEINIITGYLSDKIEDKVQKYNKSIKIKIIYNPFYEISSPIISLWTCIGSMVEDFVIINSDTFYNKGIFTKIDSRPKERFELLVSTQIKFLQDDVKVRYRNNMLLEVSKKILPENAQAISTGIFIVNGRENIIIFKNKILDLIKIEQYVKKGIWHELINQIVKDNFRVDVKFVERKYWFEIDTKEDFEYLIKTVKAGESYSGHN